MKRTLGPGGEEGGSDKGRAAAPPTGTAAVASAAKSLGLPLSSPLGRGGRGLGKAKVAAALNLPPAAAKNRGASPAGLGGSGLRNKSIALHRLSSEPKYVLTLRSDDGQEGPSLLLFAH